MIEITEDINLGCNEIDDFGSYSKIIKAYTAQPLTHPTLIKTGVSVLMLDGFANVTIFSSNGSSIKHANITMKNSSNIIIRNIKFDELWEWDEETNGDYDRNDWDYMTIDSACNGIWIDHCTFYKAYDGVIDVKNPSPENNVTISWCEFLPGSEDDIFFDAMMDELDRNSEKYPYYQHLLVAGMTKSQIRGYAYGQKKTHLFGQSDEAANAAGIKVTLANNYYYNSMDRMPRLRYGYTHVYNCIMDAQELRDTRKSITNEDIAKKIVSNGASSTCGAQVLLENCYINGIENALNSGNGSSPSGYINAVNSLYYLDGVKTTLEPKCNSTGDTRVLITDADEFTAKLPYSDYSLYPADKLAVYVQPYAGAGKLDLTVLQWEKTSYNDSKKDDVPTEKPTEKPTEGATEKPTEGVTEKPTEKPTEGVTEKPTEKPTEGVTEKPTEKPTEEVTEKPTEKPTEGATEKPTEKPTEEVTEKPTEKPTEGVTEKPTEKPTEGVTEKPTEKPTESFRGQVGNIELTDNLKNITGAGSVEELKTFMGNKLLNSDEAKKILSGIDMADMQVVDIVVQVKVGNTWNSIDGDKLPDGGVDIVIPYPEGIDKDNYDFIIGHLITSNVNGATSGTMEFFEPEKTADGLKIHITSASPFIIGWKQAADRGLTAPAQSANTGYITGGIVPILIVFTVLSVAVAAFAVFNRRKLSKSGK